jgi:hypothetical protein
VFVRFFKGDAGAQTVRDIQNLEEADILTASADTPINTLKMTQRVRQGLTGKLKNMTSKATSPNGSDVTLITPEAFGRFKEDYGAALGMVFRPAEIDRIKNVTSMKSALARKEADTKDFKNRVEKFPWGSASIASDPAKLFRATWSSGGKEAADATTIKANIQLLDAVKRSGDESALTDYRKLIAHDIMDKSSKNGILDPKALDAYLTKNQGRLEEWYTTPGDNKSGFDFVQNMKAYADMGRRIQENTSMSFADTDPLVRAVNSIARAYVGVFTTPGRILTAVKQLGGGETLKREADFLLNPRKYVRNQEFYEILTSPGFRAAQRAGGHEFMMLMREDQQTGQSGSVLREDQRGAIN